MATYECEQCRNWQSEATTCEHCGNENFKQAVGTSEGRDYSGVGIVAAGVLLLIISLLISVPTCVALLGIGCLLSAELFAILVVAVGLAKVFWT